MRRRPRLPGPYKGLLLRYRYGSRQVTNVTTYGILPATYAQAQGTFQLQLTVYDGYVGDHPTYWIEPGIPHDGYLAEFLMRTKAVIRD